MWKVVGLDGSGHVWIYGAEGGQPYDQALAMADTLNGYNAHNANQTSMCYNLRYFVCSPEEWESYWKAVITKERARLMGTA